MSHAPYTPLVIENKDQAATVEAARRAQIQVVLISWFEKNARELPWRRTRDPWRVLVSEVMLQQNQVKRPVLFYERFLARFPTV
jgi:A/G-specific adenine glycosylase